MDRRDFLTTSAAGAVAAAGLRVSGAIAQEAATADKPSAALNLGSQESKLPGKSLREKVENLQKFGGTGLEIGGNVAGRAQELKDAIAGTNVKISAVCAGYFALIDPDKAERQKGAERLKEVLSAAGEVGSTGVIMVPAFNKHPQLVGREAREALVELLPALGEHANKCGTRVLLEPLNRKEAYFLRQLADAASICRDAGSSGICMMGDFYHMYTEETSDLGAFVSAGKYLHHVHLASIKRFLPGQDHLGGLDTERSFIDGFRGLKMIGYQDYCSLECTVKGDAAVEIPKAFEFLRKQWDQATV